MIFSASHDDDDGTARDCERDPEGSEDCNSS